MIDEYVKNHSHKAVGFTSLGQLRYLSALQYMDAMVGNSSSGLIEAPSFKIGTINIGDRQKGRIMAESIISCVTDKSDITKAFQLCYSSTFKNKLLSVENPYGNGQVSKTIIKIIKQIDFSNILKKSFYNINIK